MYGIISCYIGDIPKHHAMGLFLIPKQEMKDLLKILNILWWENSIYQQQQKKKEKKRTP